MKEISSVEEIVKDIESKPITLLLVEGENPFIHTHGLEKFNHKNIEMIPVININHINDIMIYVIGSIMTGTKLENKTIFNIPKYGSVYVYETERELDGIMFRLLLPDALGYFPIDERCSKRYKKQLI
jgi:sporulation protein YlmC with PRC-barrel domain